MTPDREPRELALRRSMTANSDDLRYLFQRLDAERVRCADLERERDGLLSPQPTSSLDALRERATEVGLDWVAKSIEMFHWSTWAVYAGHGAQARRAAVWKEERADLERERDGWKARYEQLRDDCRASDLGAAQARVAVLEKALSYYADEDTGSEDGGECAREALAVAGRPGSGAPAELRSIIESYLLDHGFNQTGGYWGHPELGQGRTLAHAVEWQIGREYGEAAPECPHCHVELVDGTCVAGCYYRAPETQEGTP